VEQLQLEVSLAMVSFGFALQQLVEQ
jgi:hypothetical protein